MKYFSKFYSAGSILPFGSSSRESVNFFHIIEEEEDAKFLDMMRRCCAY
jgi:hypothetical protein